MAVLIAGRRFLWRSFVGTDRLKRALRSGSRISRQLSSFQKELVASQFCNVRVACPYAVEIKPLDVHKHRHQDRVILNVQNGTEQFRCTVDDDLVRIEDQDLDSGVTDSRLSLEVPVKANIDVSTKHGDVLLHGLNNDFIAAETLVGNITIGKCQSTKISLISHCGNIECNGAVQAAEIAIKTASSGSVKTGRLQGLHLAIESETGDITVESSYCDKSVFKSKSGRMRLRNVHKNCKVDCGAAGNLSLVGFDGRLEALLQCKTADLQITRILEDSKIVMEDSGGTLVLLLDENCQKGVNFLIEADHLITDENTSLRNSSKKSSVAPNFSVQNKNGTVKIATISWSQMFASAFKKKTK